MDTLEEVNRHVEDGHTRLVVYNLYLAKRNVPKRHILLGMELSSASPLMRR